MGCAEGSTTRNSKVCNFKLIKSRRLRWEDHVARMEKGTPRGKMPLGRLRRRWEDNIRMELKEIRGTGFIRLKIKIIGEPFVNAALNLQVS